MAKGVRRTTSKFGARLEPFAHIDVQLLPGKNLDIITQVQTVDAFATDIVDDYSRYTTACAVLETAERLAGEERAPAPQLQRLTVGALRAIAEQARPVEFVLDAFLLRAMGYAGWAPASKSAPAAVLLDRTGPFMSPQAEPCVPIAARRVLRRRRPECST